MSERDAVGKCADCNWWTKNVSALSAFKFQGETGECRRYAPRGPVQATIEIGLKRNHKLHHVVNAFSPTASDDWCGEYEGKHGAD